MRDNEMIFVDIDERYLPEVLRLNNNEVPEVNRLSLAVLQQLSSEAFLAQLCEDEHAVAGAVLGFLSGANYDGFNYHWFCQRYQHFLYIDRIFVNPAYRGQGVGKAIYQRVFEVCQRHGLRYVCCEVNEEPPNPVSHHFHLSLGFQKIESVLHPEGKTVAMYCKELTPA